VTNVANAKTPLEAGTFADVPTLWGTNSEEGRLFAIGQTNATAYLESILPGLTAFQNSILAQYPANQSGYFTVADIQTDIGFQCPVAAITDIAVTEGYDVWRYYYDASFPNASPFPDSGVYHASEIVEVFGTYTRANATAQQVALSAYMQTAWANFAKNPSVGPGWPMAVRTVGDLGGNGSLGEFDILASSIDGPCTVLAPIIATQGL